MELSYTITGTITVPDGTVAGEYANQFVLPSGAIISISPIVEYTYPEEETVDLSYDAARHLGIIMEDYDRTLEMVDETLLLSTVPEVINNDSDVKGFPTVDYFIESAKRITKSSDPVYDFYFDSHWNDYNLIYAKRGDDYYLGGQDIAELEVRYTKLLTLLALVPSEITVTDLAMVATIGDCLVIFNYKDKDGKLQKIRYVRDGGPEGMIPLDLLQDLERLTK